MLNRQRQLAAQVCKVSAGRVTGAHHSTESGKAKQILTVVRCMPVRVS